MDWRKRKKRRKIAKHYGWDHWVPFNKYMKFLIKTPVSRYIVNNREEFTWREVLDAMNKLCDVGGRPEKKMTEFEFWRAIREELKRMHAIRDEKIIHWIEGEMQSKAIEDFGDITQEEPKPSFSIQVVGNTPKPSFSVRSLSEQATNPPLDYRSKENQERIEKLQRYLWCTSYDAAVMSYHMAVQQQNKEQYEDLSAIIEELKQVAKDNPIPDDVIRGRSLTNAEAMSVCEPTQSISDFTATIPGIKPIDESKIEIKMIHKRGDGDGKEDKGTT